MTFGRSPYTAKPTPLNLGNSGGALADSHGRISGISTADARFGLGLTAESTGSQ